MYQMLEFISLSLLFWNFIQNYYWIVFQMDPRRLVEELNLFLNAKVSAWLLQKDLSLLKSYSFILNDAFFRQIF